MAKASITFLSMIGLLTGSLRYRPKYQIVIPFPGVNFMGLRRIWTRGMQSAGKFMLGAAIAYNLKKWMNYEQRNRKTAIMSLKKAQKVFFFWIIGVTAFNRVRLHWISKPKCQKLNEGNYVNEVRCYF
jgi:hypothetical protein